ncbi:hypothetical protein FZEAL_2420 [Fusarium zealandicum]|uniref:Zn(2)-C6 fungal-type domain-containing protein n=1 Tax=Fusarium zealandicum TaxID=1053134 RepID=A0A8H4XNL4_9HYPO|nr:hypothetical protein FZEAL_2420 [Fusarium zealandicum]
MADPTLRKDKKRPKVKGCYECARRRIDCDRQQPECRKCIGKGLQCTGLGKVYRFTNSLATRGKLAGRSVPDILSYKRVAESSASPQKARSCRPFRRAEEDKTESTASFMAMKNARPDPLSQWVDPQLDHINGETRWCLQYFSDHVAPVTAVIDQGFNGYRDLILPAAEADPLIRQAIVTVTREHFQLHQGVPAALWSNTYTSLIRKLILRSEVISPHQDESAMTALLLLHIRQMISGSEDFKLTFGSLRTVVNALGYGIDKSGSTLGKFVRIQILRVCLFGEALFDEMEGALFLLNRGEDCLEFLRFCLDLHPEYKGLMGYLFDLIKLACLLYTQRVIENPQPEKTVPIVESFKQIALKVDDYVGTVGQHLLAWSYFIVAAESSTSEHRKFFLDKLASLYCETKCGNIRKAMEQVVRIWAVPEVTRWTSLLGGPTQALIM